MEKQAASFPHILLVLVVILFENYTIKAVTIVYKIHLIEIILFLSTEFYIDKQIEFTLRHFLLNFSYVVWWRRSTALLLYAVQIYRRISLEISR